MSKVVSGRLKKHPSKIFFTFLLVPHSNMFAKVLFNQTPLKKKKDFVLFATCFWRCYIGNLNFWNVDVSAKPVTLSSSFFHFRGCRGKSNFRMVVVRLIQTYKKINVSSMLLNRTALTEPYHIFIWPFIVYQHAFHIPPHLPELMSP